MPYHPQKWRDIDGCCSIPVRPNDNDIQDTGATHNKRSSIEFTVVIPYFVTDKSWQIATLRNKPHYVAGVFMLWLFGSSCFVPLRKVIGMHFYRGLKLSIFQCNH